MQNAHHKLIRRIRSRMDELNAWLQFQNLKIHWIKQLYYFMKSIEKFKPWQQRCMTVL